MTSRYTDNKNLSELFLKPSLVPRRLDMELTERCNNNCIHCYINQNENDSALAQKELSTDEIKRIISKAADAGVMTIRFTGGEPLLRDDFKEIYLHTRRCGINVSLFTNATLINEEIVDLFRQYPAREKIEITLYGLSKEEYEEVSRNPGSFEAALKGINLLLDALIPFVIKGVFIHEISEDIKKLDTYARLIPFMDKKPRIAMNFDLRARRDNHKKNLRIESLRATPEETIQYLSQHRESYINDMKRFAAQFMTPASDFIFTCGCGHVGAVDAYGFLQPCLLMRAPESVYDIKHGTFEDAYKVFFKQLRELKATHPEYEKKCRNCFLNSLCERCPAKSWMEHGSLDSPVEYYCGIAHAQAEFLGLLNPGEKSWQVSDWQKRVEAFIQT